MIYLDSKDGFILNSRDWIINGLPVYYVSGNGSVSGDGSLNNPYRDFDQCHDNGYMRPGIYYITSGTYTKKTGDAIINLAPHVQIYGNGFATLDCAVEDAQMGVRMELPVRYVMPYRKTYIEKLTVKYAEYGFHNNPFSAYPYDIKYCTANNCFGTGFVTGSNTLTNCTAHRCGDGFQSTSTWWGDNGSSFINCHAISNSNHGFHGASGWDYYLNCNSEYNTKYGYYNCTHAYYDSNTANNNTLGDWGGELPTH